MKGLSANLVAALFAVACLDASAAEPVKSSCVPPEQAATTAKPSSPNAGMPNRISMNVTVPKQTQGATFGEKVNQGLHAAGGALAQGASAAPAAVPACDDAAAARVKEKTGASDASAGKGAGSERATVEKNADTAAAAEADRK